jgi:hypothetical protein
MHDSGVRMLMPDRPGYGGSTRGPGRSVADGPTGCPFRNRDRRSMLAGPAGRRRLAVDLSAELEPGLRLCWMGQFDADVSTDAHGHGAGGLHGQAGCGDSPCDAVADVVPDQFGRPASASVAVLIEHSVG